MLEKTLERKLKKRVEALGCLCLKFESPGYSGVPDRIILLPEGEVWFVEMKAPGKKERHRQEYVQKQFRNRGIRVFSSVDSEEKIQEIIDKARTWLQMTGHIP